MTKTDAPLGVEPRPDLYMTAAEICRWRPFLSARTLKTWVALGIIAYSKTSPGQTARNLYTLGDVDATLAQMRRPATDRPKVAS